MLAVAGSIVQGYFVGNVGIDDLGSLIDLGDPDVGGLISSFPICYRLGGFSFFLACFGLKLKVSAARCRYFFLLSIKVRIRDAWR